MQASLAVPLLIFISFDGFRHDYLRPDLTPNLHKLVTRSSMGNMQSMPITKTFPNHFSMATGLYEDEHEVINNKMYDPRLNETLKQDTNSTKWWNYKGTNLPIWIANELISEQLFNEQRYSGSMMYPGSAVAYGRRSNGQAHLPTYLRSYAKNANWTENVDVVLSWLTNPERPANFVSMYFDEPDSVAHWNGPWANATLEAVRGVDQAAGYLMRRLDELGLANKANVIFVSDHGMAEIKSIAYFNDFMDTSGFEIFGNSPDWSVFVKKEKRHLKSKIYRDLVAASRTNHFQVFRRKQDLPASMRHYSKTPRIGDFFIMVDEGHDIYWQRPSAASAPVLPKVWGNHGWNPANADMRPLFLAHGPAFKQNFEHREVFPNIDLFPLMLLLLDLPQESVPNNGSLARVLDLLNVDSFATRLNSL